MAAREELVEAVEDMDSSSFVRLPSQILIIIFFFNKIVSNINLSVMFCFKKYL